MRYVVLNPVRAGMVATPGGDPGQAVGAGGRQREVRCRDARHRLGFVDALNETARGGCNAFA